jgi:hypothetical protein
MKSDIIAECIAGEPSRIGADEGHAGAMFSR